MQGDLEFAARCPLDVIGKRLHVFGLEAAGGVAGRQVPLGLCKAGRRDKVVRSSASIAFMGNQLSIKWSANIVKKLARWWLSKSVMSIAPGACVMQRIGLGLRDDRLGRNATGPEHRQFVVANFNGIAIVRTR